MRSRRNNTTLTRKVDKWNPRKVWLIKRYADGHYAINQEVGGRVFLFQLPESNQGANRRDLRLLLKTPRSPALAGPIKKGAHHEILLQRPTDPHEQNPRI